MAGGCNTGLVVVYGLCLIHLSSVCFPVSHTSFLFLFLFLFIFLSALNFSWPPLGSWLLGMQVHAALCF